MKREARLICPILDNDGNPVGEALQSVETALGEAFGGFTYFVGDGVWYNPAGKRFADGVNIYDVAIDDTPNSRHRLRQIALQFLKDAKQQAVYLRWPDGEVIFVD